MGGVYRIQTFLDFNIFLIFTRPLSVHFIMRWRDSFRIDVCFRAFPFFPLFVPLSYLFVR